MRFLYANLRFLTIYMRIKNLKIENYRCFEQKELSFDPHFNVVIGENGVGKTTILDAIACALKPIFTYLRGVGAIGIDKEDCRRVKFGRTEEFVREVTRLQIAFQNMVINGNSEQIEYESKQSAYDLFSMVALPETIGELFTYPKQEQKLSLIVYYPTDRLIPKTSQIEKNAIAPNGSRLIGYENALNNKNINIQQITTRIDTLERDESKYEKEVVDVPSLREELESTRAELNSIKTAIINCIPNCKKVIFSSQWNEIMIVFENGELKPFSKLSEGFRNTLAIVADIAYRCARLNSHLEENILTETEGIVLIDDLDLHLHPNWQRRIVPDLKRTFPKIQFIVSTHSPFIVQSLRKEELINLQDSDEISEGDPFRKSIEEVAEDEMGVHNVQRSSLFLEMQQNAATFFDLVKKGVKGKDLAEAKRKLDELMILYSDDAAYTALLKTKLPQSI